MKLEPFDYQLDGIDKLRQGYRLHRRGLLVMLMGAGKTILSMEIMRLISEKGTRALFINDRRMLTQQVVRVAEDQGLHAGMILAGHGIDLSAPCQFGSKQTIVSWLKNDRIQLPDFNLIVTDECHRATSEEWQKLHARWPKALHLGLTATPCLGNGSGLGAYYDFIVQPIQPSGLRERGRIVPVRAFAPHVPNLEGVKKDKDGDYSAKSLSERMTRENLVGDIVGWWQRIAQGRPSIYFACDVAHALCIRDEFRGAGIGADLICDETEDEERDDIRRRLESGEIQVVVNCDVLAEGIDWPFVSCIGIVRPTKRLRRYLQCVGRGLRAFLGKTDCIVIDHAGCVLYHGFPDTDRDWPLGADDNVDDKNQEKKTKEQQPIRCIKCSAIFSGSRTCPECGHVHIAPKLPKDYGGKAGSLIEVSHGTIDPEIAGIAYQRFWGVCIGAAIRRHQRAGVAAAMFSSKFNLPPWKAGVKPLPPHRGDWQRPARDVFPGFVRSKV